MGIIIFSLFMLSFAGCALTPEQSSRDKIRISKEELKDRLNDPSLIILDVRLPKDWKKSGKKIKGAIQKDPFKFAKWFSQYPKTKTIVLYWAWPNEQTSARLARKMMTKGYASIYVLKGGWNEWLKAEYPIEPI